MGDKDFTLTNNDMEAKIESLSTLLDRDDVIGYVAARNTRRLQDASFEYAKIKIDLLNKYGKEVLDDNNNPTGRITLSSSDPHYDEVVTKLEQTANIEHVVKIFVLPYEEVKNKLTGREILQIDWMLDE